MGSDLTPHLGTLLASPYEPPNPTPFVDPVHHILTRGFCDFCQAHTNLSLGGETVSGALRRKQIDFIDLDRNNPCDLFCQPHVAFGAGLVSSLDILNTMQNGFPYVWPFDHRRESCRPETEAKAIGPSSQVDIANSLEADVIMIGNSLASNSLNVAEPSESVAPATLESDYRMIVASLREHHPDAVIVCPNVEYASWGPIYMTAEKADGLLAMGPLAGNVPPVAATLGMGPGDLVNLRLMVKKLLGFPDVTVPVITTEKQAQRRALVHAYNEAIHRVAKSQGALYVDVDDWYREEVEAGTVVEVDGTAIVLNAEYGGGFYGYDGSHLTRTGHASAANKAIRTLNAKLHLKIEPVHLNKVASQDLHVRRLLE